MKQSNPFSHIRFGLPGNLNLEESALFKFLLLVEDPGKEVTVNTLSLILRNSGNEGATQLQGNIDIDTSKYGEWVEYEIDFSGATLNDDYQLINVFFAQPDVDDDATGMVYYIDNIRGPFLK